MHFPSHYTDANTTTNGIDRLNHINTLALFVEYLYITDDIKHTPSFSRVSLTLTFTTREIILVYHRKIGYFGRALEFAHILAFAITTFIHILVSFIRFAPSPLLPLSQSISVRSTFIDEIPANGKCLNNKFDHLFWYSYGNSMIIYFKSQLILWPFIDIYAKIFGISDVRIVVDVAKNSTTIITIKRSV